MNSVRYVKNYRAAADRDTAGETPKALQYLTTSSHRMRYARFCGHGLCVGSGVIDCIGIGSIDLKPPAFIDRLIPSCANNASGPMRITA